MCDTPGANLLGTIVVAGVATKMAQNMFGNPITASTKSIKKKAKKGFPSTQYRPW